MAWENTRQLVARKKLSDYIEKLKSEGRIPEDHEFLIGAAEHAGLEEGAPQKPETAFRTYYLFARAEVTGQAIEDAFVAKLSADGKSLLFLVTDDRTRWLGKRSSVRGVSRSSRRVEITGEFIAPLKANFPAIEQLNDALAHLNSTLRRVTVENLQAPP